MVGPIEVDKKAIQHNKALKFHAVIFLVSSINQVLETHWGDMFGRWCSQCIHSASLIWSRYSHEMCTPPCLGCSLGSGSGLLYIAARAMTERKLLKMSGVGSS